MKKYAIISISASLFISLLYFIVSQIKPQFQAEAIAEKLSALKSTEKNVLWEALIGILNDSRDKDIFFNLAPIITVTVLNVINAALLLNLIHEKSLGNTKLPPSLPPHQ